MRLVFMVTGLAVLLAAACAAPGGTNREQAIYDGNADGFKTMERLGDGWLTKDGMLVGESPEYYSLPETAGGDFGDSSWTYLTVYPVALWRYALVGQPEATDYSVECVLKIEKAAPLKGFRWGETFFNYQWGREAFGSDAAIVVRYKSADDNYMVRLSSGFQHLELWKTHGGVVRVKAYPFEAGKSYRLTVTASGPWIIAAVDGKELMRYHDPIEPVLSGRVGVAVRESKVAFSEFKVVPAKAIKKSSSKHKPDFRVREWVGKKYIFDGDEPIAWFFWNPTEGMQLREMKLAPGLMPMVMPNLGIASYQYQTNGVLKIAKEGASFAFSTRQQGKNDAFECSSDWTLTFQPGSGYVWDKRVRFTALKDNAEPGLQIDDPFFYQMVAPQTDKLPKCRALPNYCIFDNTEGKRLAFPSAHHLWTDGAGALRSTTIATNGYAVPTIDGWGVAVHFPADNRTAYRFGFCHWGLDFHLSALEAAALKKGGVFDGHMVYTLWYRDQVQAALKAGLVADPQAPHPPELFNNIEPTNHFQNLSPGLTGESVRLWTGNYKVDRTTGRNDSICMRIDTREIKERKSVPRGDDRPNIWQGSSYWTGPYLAPRYRIGMWVKADRYTGKVAIIADGFSRPKPGATKEYRAEVAIAGKCDWTFVSFETDMPRNTSSWVLRIDPMGEGVIWVDDVEISPLAGQNH